MNLNNSAFFSLLLLIQVGMLIRTTAGGVSSHSQGENLLFTYTAHPDFTQLSLPPLAPSPRVLKVFLSRTAQRTPYMTSWRVLRLLAVILLVVLWFLVAWTSAVCQSPELSRALITAGLTPEGLQFSMCLLDRWDYMMAVGECVCVLSVFLYLHVPDVYRCLYRKRNE